MERSVVFRIFAAVLIALGMAFSAVGQVQTLPIDFMPIVVEKEAGYTGMAPREQRGPEFNKYLSASVKISCRNCSGSGTIVYYDEAKNTAYVATCGHLWSGAMSAQENRNVTCNIITWYHNEQKLPEPKSYPAKVHFYSSGGAGDTALVTFQPDWKPNYFPIAPLDYKIAEGTRLHSCGCDGGREVAHYDVRFTGYRSKDLVTVENSPRPGRSGGGLLSDDGYYVGTCWGTSTYSGEGQGYFTRLSTIHDHWNRNGFGFLLKVGKAENLAQSIPIVDKNNPQAEYPKEYILIPNRITR